MRVEHTIKMDLGQRQNVPTISVLQCDTNTRVLHLFLYSNGTPWNVPEDTLVAIAYIRSDGSKGIYDTMPDGSSACRYRDNEMFATIVPQAISTVGETKIVIVFTNSIGEQLASFVVSVNVLENPAIGAIEPECYINLQQDIDESVKEAISKIGAPSFRFIADPESYGKLTARLVEDGFYLINASLWDDAPMNVGSALLVFRYSTNYVLQLAVSTLNGSISTRIVNRKDFSVYRDWAAPDGTRSVRILCDGDSIAYGARNGKKGFVGDLGVPYRIDAVPGATLSNVVTDCTNIPDQLTAAEDYVPDVVIANGGINDYVYNAAMGEMPAAAVTTAAEAAALDRSTVLGGLQYLLYQMGAKYPDAKHYFLLTHKTTKSGVDFTVTANKAGYTQTELFGAIKTVCGLYGVEVIDVFSESCINTGCSAYVSPTKYADDNSVTNREWVDSDGVHPLAYGYLHGYVPIVRRVLGLGGDGTVDPKAIEEIIEGYIAKNPGSYEDLPSKLPNPYALDINGTTYDGSTAVSIKIPSGADGLTPYIGGNGNWWIGETDTGVKAAGKDGADGEQGSPGDNGYTPVRGVDYWTEEDQAAIDADIAAELAKRGQLKPEFANTVEECTDTSKLYVLPDGYIYAHMTKEMHTEAPELFDRNACTLNARYSGTTEKAANGYYITDFIPVDMSLSDPIVLRFKGGKMWTGSGDKLMLFDSAKNVIDTTYIYSDESSGSNLHHEVYADGDDYCIDLGYVATTGASAKHASYANIAYIRINQCINSAGTACTVENIPNVSVTIDAMGGSSVTTGWCSTGHAFVPADYEDRIVALESTAEDQEARLTAIETAGTVTVPDYWQEAVDAAVAKVKALQDEGGSDVINFIWFSDLHYAPGNAYVSNVGTLCAALMEACDIPLTLMCGDTMSAAAVASEDLLLSYLEGAAKVLAPIGHEGLMLIRGNHDDVYGSYTDGETTTYYVNKVAPAKIYNRIHRAQHRDFRRVWGGDGTYFYLDTPQQVRIVCLNSHYYSGEAITGGTTGAMTSGFGAEQLAWLRDTALAVGEGWSVVIATHTPPTAQAVNGNTGYLAQLSDGEAFREIVSAAAADITGIFCGHCHADAIVSGDLPCPILTVTCATNSPYDGTAANRAAGTATETAIDIVSINTTARTISLTRLGAGEDRSVNY